MASVPAYPMPAHLVLLRDAVKSLPQVNVLHRFFIGGFPAPAFPLRHPFGDAGFYISGIGRQVDFATRPACAGGVSDQNLARADFSESDHVV